MALRIDSPSLRPLSGAVAPARVGSATAAPAGQFGQALQQALKAVSQTQNQAGSLQTGMQLEKDGASIEQTMIAMQKSNLAFTAAVTVRNKMVSAYSEIMNMQV